MHKMGDDGDSSRNKIKKIESKIAKNDEDIGTFSVVATALAESTTPGQALTMVRKSLVSITGNDDLKLVNSRYQVAQKIIKNIKTSGKFTDADVLKANTVLTAKIMSLHVQNQYYNAQINYYQSGMQISNFFSKPQVGGFSNGFGGGGFSGGGVGNRNSW